MKTLLQFLKLFNNLMYRFINKVESRFNVVVPEHFEIIDSLLAWRYVENSDTVDITCAKYIENEAAVILGRWCKSLNLDGLESINEIVAQSISHADFLSLNGLRKINAATAFALSPQTTDPRNYRLLLNGLNDISKEVAIGLSQESSKQLISLDGLTFLSDELAEAVSQIGASHVSLNGLVEINAKVAKSLSRMCTLKLSVNGLRNLSISQANNLISNKEGFVPELELNGLSEITREVAESLSNYHRDINLNGMKYIKNDVILGFSKYACRLYLDGITELNERQFELLSYCSFYGLSLNGINKLKFNKPLLLNSNCSIDFLNLEGLTSLNPIEAEALSNCSRRMLYLNGLTTMTSDVAEVLSNHQGVRIELCGLTHLSDKSARAIAHYRGQELFIGINPLDINSAMELSNYSGKSLILCGLITIDKKMAVALSKLKVDSLQLVGPVHISDEAADALSEFQGSRFGYNGKFSLSKNAASLFANYKGLINEMGAEYWYSMYHPELNNNVLIVWHGNLGVKLSKALSPNSSLRPFNQP